MTQSQSTASGVFSNPLRSHTQGWRPDIQGLRALAVVLVVAYHAGLPVTGGFIGVDVFFVISGFVITLLLLREWTVNSRRGLRRFWAGRVRRLMPALTVVVIVVLALSALLEDPSGAQQQTARTALASLLMVSNIFLERSGSSYFLEPTYVNPLLNTWSLGVEEQFYILFPLLFLLLIYRAHTRTRRLAWGLILVAGLSFTLSTMLTFSAVSLPLIPNSETFAFFSMTTRAWQFSLGALLAIAAYKQVQLSRPLRELLGFMGLALVLIGAFTLTSSTPYPGIAALIPTFGAMGLLAAGLGGPWLGVSLLSSQSATFIGNRSYSIYLWHWPLLVFVGIAFPDSWVGVLGALFLTVVLSMATYRWIENPFRFARRPRAATSVALAFVALGIAVGVGVGQAIKFGWGQSWTLGAHEAMQRDCDNPPIDPERCRWGSSSARPEVLVVGDSQAWASGDAIIDATLQLGGSTVITAFNNCPFTAGVLPSEGECGDWQSDVLDFIQAEQPDVVIIATAPYSGVTPFIADQTMTEISRRGANPIFLLNPPGDPEGGRRSLLLRPNPDRTTPVVEGQFLREEVGALRTKWGASAIIDPHEVFCDGATCVTAREGVEYYTDGNHLSVDGAALLIPLFKHGIEDYSGAPPD